MSVVVINFERAAAKALLSIFVCDDLCVVLDCVADVRVVRVFSLLHRAQEFAVVGLARCWLHITLKAVVIREALFHVFDRVADARCRANRI